MAPPQDVSPVRLSDFRVKGLFDQFDYTIPLNTTERITAIIAPNGSGKTVCLRLINALFRRQWSLFQTTYFHEINFGFLDGQSVCVSRDVSPDHDDEATAGPAPVIELSIKSRDHSGTDILQKWTPTLADISKLRLPGFEQYIPIVTRVGTNRWVHDITGQDFSAQELVESFPDHIPPHILSGFYAHEPEQLKTIIDNVDCHLIETQRLLIFSNEERARYRSDRRPSSTLAISQKAQALKAIIGQTLTGYAALSQSLDRSFPRRVIQRSEFVPAAGLKTRLDDLDEQRSQLMRAGLLGTEATDPVNLPPGEIGDAIGRVLSVYADDTKNKLDYLSPLLAKVRLFKELIDQRFRSKTLQVDRERGFRVLFQETDVPLDKLSSGEQHQLVLLFELLFELKSNALILIDEPELSLHVAWQRKFISDLRRIIDLNTFDVILATHSPQLIARWEQLVVDLGDVDDEE